MIEIVYFTTRNRANQTKTFGSVKAFNTWTRRNRDVLIDYTVVKQPAGANLPLHKTNAESKGNGG